MGKNQYNGLKEIKKILKDISSISSGSFYVSRERLSIFSGSYDFRRWAATLNRNYFVLAKTLPILRESINTVCAHLEANDKNEDRLQILAVTLADLDKYKISKYLEQTIRRMSLPTSGIQGYKSELLQYSDSKAIFTHLKMQFNECVDILNEIMNYKTEYMQLQVNDRLHKSISH